jgi:hypothetical protein
MKSNTKRTFIAYAAAIAVAALVVGQQSAGSGSGQQAAGPQFTWDKYHTYDEVTSYVRHLAQAYPELASLESAGKTTMKQRDIWVLTITNRKTGDPSKKPAFFLDGGTHAGELGGSETALYTAWYLVTQYGRDPEITELLDTRTMYVMPRKDADGMEVAVTGRIDYDPAMAPGATDADGDGRIGEDGPSDIDGDGMVLQMRIPDPNGEWKASEKDPRIMNRRQHGDTGRFYRLMAEGKDDDGDGLVNEDPPRTGFSSNRNYPARWANELSTRRGQGDFPLQEPETRATVEFVYRHPNIAGMQSLHHYGGVILRPFCNLEDEAFPPQDLVYYDAIANRGREITDYGYVGVYNDFTGNKDAARHGVQLDWGYLQVGVITFTTEQWRYAGNVGAAGEWRDQTPEEQMARNDREFGGRHFVNWRPFKHPQLGDIEIGGWVPHSLRNPPPDIMEERMLEPNMRFIVYHASTTPLVRISEAKAMPGAGGHRIVATIVNEGFLPTNVTEHAIRAKLARPVMVEIETGPGVSLVSGSRRANIGHLEGTPAVVQEFSFGSQTFGGANRRTVEWVVAGTGEVTIRAVSQKGGTDTRSIVVGGTTLNQ